MLHTSTIGTQANLVSACFCLVFNCCNTSSCFCCFFIPGFFAQGVHTFQDLQVSSSTGKSPNFTRFVHRKSPSPSTRPGHPAFSPPLSPRFGGCSRGHTSPPGSSRASFTSSKATLRCRYGRWPWLRQRRAGRCAAAWKMAFA